jgi:hypothetical protein
MSSPAERLRGAVRDAFASLQAAALVGAGVAGCSRAVPPVAPHSAAAPTVETAPNPPRQRTGLLVPTEAERAQLEAMAVKTGEVKPNRLGLERINAERAKQGLPPLKIQPAPDGQEVVPAKQP